MIRTTLLLGLGLASPLNAQTPAPATHTDPAAIEAAVATFIGAGPAAAAPVDRRLRLARCAQALDTAWFGTAQEAVEVRCPGPGGWRIFVPVRRAFQQPAAAAQPLIRRGDQVTITVAGSGFAVTQQGEALEQGAQGAWIKVRGLSAGAQVLRARVIRPGQVGMELP